MLRWIVVAVSLGCWLLTLNGPRLHAEETPPNLIFFLSDDQRADFLGCAGHPILKTPHLDALAQQGMRFKNAFVTTSICAASRATIFSGCWERTHKYTFGTPPLRQELVAASYPAVLKRQGYRTGFVGKFGIGIEGQPAAMFDWFRSLNRSPYFKKQASGGTRHLTDIIGDQAIEFVQKADPQQPFCLSVSFNASHAEDGDKVNHYPWPPSEEGLYEAAVIPPPLVRTDHWKTLPEFFHNSMHRDRWFWRWDTPEKYQRNVKAYYRMITGLDRNIGRVVAELKKNGQFENTVILFMGDNGYYKGSRGFAGKWSHFEESLRVPLIVYDPSLPKANQGRVSEVMALNVDIAPTLLDYAGAAKSKVYQGQSLRPIVTGQTKSLRRKDFFCEHLMDHPKIPKYEGVRGQRYVYARYFEHLPEGEFLHDLHTDPLQEKNLVTDPKYAEILLTQRQRCDELRNQLGGAYNAKDFPSRRNRPRKAPTKPKPEKATQAKQNR